MKTKLEMAHEFMLAMIKAGCSDGPELLERAWQYADAMQAEADKREKEKQDKLKQDQQNHHAGQHFDDVEEWQPDWSQAPEWAKWWVMDGDEKTRWIYSELEQPYISDMFLRWFAIGRFDSEDAPSFGYTGDWRDSLRKRPN